MTDYIRLPRSALDIIGDKDLWQLYGYLLSKADENGIVNTTLATMQRDLRINQKPLRTMLARLERANLGAKSGANKGSKITLCHSDSYTTQGASKRANLGAKGKASKKTIKFTPPTDAEVTAYVAEKNYHFDPAAFVPFYQGKGWKVGNQPMKDWHAACCTWEIRWKQKYGERYFYELQPTPAADTAASRKAQRDRGLSLANEIVARSENLLGLYNGQSADPDDRQD